MRRRRTTVQNRLPSFRVQPPQLHQRAAKLGLSFLDSDRAPRDDIRMGLDIPDILMLFAFLAVLALCFYPRRGDKKASGAWPRRRLQRVAVEEDTRSRQDEIGIDAGDIQFLRNLARGTGGRYSIRFEREYYTADGVHLSGPATSQAHDPASSLPFATLPFGAFSSV